MISPQNIENWLKQQEANEVDAAGQRRKVYIQQRRLGDWIARIEESEEMPDLDAVDGAFLLIWHKGKSLVVRQGGAFEPWMVPTLDRTVEPELFDDSAKPKARSTTKRLGRWLKRVAQERWGIGIGAWYQWGFERRTATTEATEEVPGSERFHLFLCLTAVKLADLEVDGEWARRYATTRDLNKLVRDQHLEFETALMQAHSSYLVRQQTGSAKR